MNRRTATRITLLGAFALALVVALGWNARSPAQLGRAGKGGYADFDALLTKNGDKNMLLEVHIVTVKQGEGELLGKLVQSTDEFLVLKAQNGQDLYFVTWDDVIWVTARPN